MSAGVESGLVTAAARPIRANSASPHMPNASRRTASIPTTAAYRAGPTRMPPSRTVLSLLANVEMAKVLDRRRGEVDGGLADREHRRALRGGEPGHELRAPMATAAESHADHGPREGMRGPGLVLGEGGR